MVVLGCNPSTEGAETGRSLEFTDWPAWPIGWIPVQWGQHVRLSSVLHVYVYTQEHLHTHIQIKKYFTMRIIFKIPKIYPSGPKIILCITVPRTCVSACTIVCMRRSEDSFAWTSSGEHRLPGMHGKHLYTYQATSLAQFYLFLK